MYKTYAKPMFYIKYFCDCLNNMVLCALSIFNYLIADIWVAHCTMCVVCIVQHTAANAVVCYISTCNARAMMSSMS